MDKDKEKKEPHYVEMHGSARAKSSLKANAESFETDSGLKPKEVITLPSGDYHFGKPKMGHRDVIIKIWRQLTTASVDYEGMQKVMEGRGLKSAKELIAIPEEELTPEEIALIMKGVGGEKNMEDIVAVMGDVLAITLRKAPFEEITKKAIDENLDFDEGLELAQNGILWIKETVIGIKERKNLQRLSSQEATP